MKSRLRQKIQEVTTQGLSVVVMVDCGYLPRNGRLAIKKPSPLFFPRKPLPPPLALSPPTFSPPYSPGRKISYISLSRGGEGGGEKEGGGEISGHYFFLPLFVVVDRGVFFLGLVDGGEKGSGKRRREKSRNQRICRSRDIPFLKLTRSY